MLKKLITFTNFDGAEEKVEAYFNLTKTECVDLNLEYEDDGGLIGRIKKLMVKNEKGEIPQKPAVDFIKLLVEKSYGVRPKDNPSLFLKEDDYGKPLFKKFKQTGAYDTFVYALLTGEESLEEFANAILPQINDKQKAEAEKLLAKEGISTAALHEV